MTGDSNNESFQDFKNSFSYGSRTDLNFKFLKILSNEDAAAFLQDLLWKLGDAINDGDFDRLVTHVYEGQIRAYSGEPRWAYDEGPFTPLRKPLSESRLALVTSSGHFVQGHDPEPFGVKNMSREEATERLRVRHAGYDIRGAQADPNVTFPYERLLELERDSVIGELVSVAYSFVGACAQMRLLKRTGPDWVQMLQEQRVDAALLVPV